MEEKEEAKDTVTLSWKRMSQAQAAERAREMAIQFMQGQNMKGWDWECGAASPSLISPDYRGRKVPTHWYVSIWYSRNGTAFPDPGMIDINIADGTVNFFVTL